MEYTVRHRNAKVTIMFEEVLQGLRLALPNNAEMELEQLAGPTATFVSLTCPPGRAFPFGSQPVSLETCECTLGYGKSASGCSSCTSGQSAWSLHSNV